MQERVITIPASVQERPILRVAAYCRVSSDSSDQLHSFAAQVQHYTHFISNNERMELVDIYADEGISGTKTAKRDDFNRLMADCKKGKIDRVLTKSVSRFARNTADSLLYARLLKDHGVTILFEKENIDTAYMSSEMLLALSGAQAQEESISISKNMRWSIERRMKNGTFIPSTTPYGYEMKNGVIVVCSSEADILRQIFADYIGGAFLKSIADRLTAEKVEYLPGEYGWNKNRIKRIIEDERYMGTDTYEPIIDKDTFLKANSAKDSRRTHVVGTVNADNRPLTKVACCGRCGAKLSHKANLAKRSSEYWYCQNKECGVSFKMPLAEVEEAVTQILNELIENPMLARNTDSQYTYEPSLEVQRMNNDIERMMASLDSNRDAIQKLILECAAKKYDEHKSTRHIADRLKADLERTGPLSSYSPDLFERTVSSVTIDQNGRVQLVLKTGTIVGKEM